MQQRRSCGILLRFGSGGFGHPRRGGNSALGQALDGDGKVEAGLGQSTNKFGNGGLGDPEPGSELSLQDRGLGEICAKGCHVAQYAHSTYSRQA